MYKPGQIITVRNKGQYRVTKPINSIEYGCTFCDLIFLAPQCGCHKYCYRKANNNNFDKYPHGYVLEKIRDLKPSSSGK